MIIKCNCNNCSAHLEFESENAGATITCPNCGMETTLYLSTEAPPHTTLSSPTRKRKRRKIALILTTAAIVISIAGAVLVYREKVYLPLANTLGGTLALVLAIAIVTAVTFWAVLWILFPVFVYFRLNDMIRLLEVIAMNTSPDARPSTFEH